VRTRELLRKIDRTLDRMDEHMSRGNELMDQIREEHRLNRQEHRLNREQYHRLQQESLRQEQRSQAAIERNTRVMRELLLQRQEDRVFLERIEQGIHAQTQGLLHVLDELRNGRGGPDAAPAG
jgi:GTP cyclohydrolase FolE2